MSTTNGGTRRRVAGLVLALTVVALSVTLGANAASADPDAPASPEPTASAEPSPEPSPAPASPSPKPPAPVPSAPVPSSSTAPASPAPSSEPGDPTPTASAPAPAGGTVHGFVWRDLNGDGQQQKDEPGIAGIPVLIGHPDADEASDQTVTGSSGRYTFKPQADGKYFVIVVVPKGLTATKVDVGSDATDSDVLMLDDLQAELQNGKKLAPSARKAGAKAAVKAQPKAADEDDYAIALSDVIDLDAKGKAIDAGFLGDAKPAPAPGEGGSLPVTGAALTGLLGAGGALLAGGGALVVMARRRRAAALTPA